MTVPMVSQIRKFVLMSRIAVITLQVVFNKIIPDHDAGVFNPTAMEEEKTTLDKVILLVFGGLRRWDAVYFLHISHYGYTYENCLAFFPLYPMFVRFVTDFVFYPLQYLVSTASLLLLSAAVINICLSVKLAEGIFYLGQIVTRNDTIAYKASILFCINPAVIFMIAPYSETLFMYLTVWGMLYMEKSRHITAAVLFALSCATRSNGLVNLGFILYKFVKDLFEQLCRHDNMLNVSCILIVRTVASYTVLAGITIIPFVAYQYYCYCSYCKQDFLVQLPENVVIYGKEHGLKMVGGQPSSWCNNAIPIAYSYIQKEYWNQGLFNYWELKQIPNFLLAVPVTVLVVCIAKTFYKQNRYICYTLGFGEGGSVKKKCESETVYQLQGVTLLPHVVQAVMLTVFAWPFLHIQVLTRLLFSSCPVLYWYTAYWMSANDCCVKDNAYVMKKSRCCQIETFWRAMFNRHILYVNVHSTASKLLLVYYLGYLVLGTAMFSNFLPWT